MFLNLNLFVYDLWTIVCLIYPSRFAIVFQVLFFDLSLLITTLNFSLIKIKHKEEETSVYIYMYSIISKKSEDFICYKVQLNL